MEKYQLLPPMSQSEYLALLEDIRVHGVIVPVIVDEEGNLIDGHHRARACEELGIDCPTVVRKFDSEEEKQVMAMALNMNRRHLSPEQLTEMRQKFQELVQTLRNQGKTQHYVAELTGIPRGTIARWEASGAIETDDLRMVVPKSRYGEILERYKTESVAAIAADFKVTPTRISQIIDGLTRVREVVEKPNTYQSQYGVIVICESESHQKEIYDELIGRGFSCRVVVT